MNESARDAADDGRLIAGRVAYYEPLRPPDALIAEADRLVAEATEAKLPGAEGLLREALERLVDAFLVDRRGHAESFTAAHALGRQIVERFGCPFSFEPDGQIWRLRCGVLALHSRIGLSPGGPTIGQCSICAAGDFECDHLNGQVYDGKRCYRLITRFDLKEVSLTPRPYDPRCYRLDDIRSAREVERAHNGPLAPGESLVCEHCLECSGSPREDDLDPASWGS
jgi:hypothetical protein